MSNKDHGPDHYEELEIDLREYIMLLWRAKWFLAVLVILAVGAAFIFSTAFIDEEFETYTTIQLSNVDHTYARPETARELIRSEEIAGPIIRELNEEEEWSDHRVRSYIESNIEVEEVEGTDMIALYVYGNDPLEIAELANDISNYFLTASQERFQEELEQVQREMERYEERMDDYEGRIIETEEQIERIGQGELDPAAENLISSSISQRLFNYMERMEEAQEKFFELEREIDGMEEARIVNPPFTPGSPTAPNVSLNMAIAAVLAGMLGVFVVFFREFMKEEEDE